MSKIRLNQNGMSLIELVIAAGLVSLVVALSATPLIEIKNLERRVEFQSGLDLAHQLALQKARNTEFLKGIYHLDGSGSPEEKCFSGRGTSCSTYDTASGSSYAGGSGDHGPAGAPSGSPASPSTPPPVEVVHYTQPNGLATTSEIYVTANCSATTCKQVNVEVSTKQTGGSTGNGWSSRPMLAKFSLPASALAGRQEIDFSTCLGLGRVITGINYDTLKAECLPLTGSTTCNGIASGGPINTFGQASLTDPANCQPPVNQSCGTGLARFGMISGQSSCAPAMTCSDPMSPACAAPPAPTPCVANWSPDPSSVCAGDAFTQTDLNACPSSAPQPAVGTNGAICPVSSCTMTGPVKWTDAAVGPCGVASASVSAPAGATGVIANEQMGYAGSMTMTCVDNSPAANTFDVAGAAKSCAPVKCTGLPAATEWSATGVKSAVAGPGLDPVGPWPCGGPLVITQAVPQPPGTLIARLVDNTAQAQATNSYATATSGSVTYKCIDPGPASAARSGVISYSGISCVLPAATAAPTATPACQPDGYMTGVWGGADDTLCTSVSSFAGSGNQPYALCCSGIHHPNYGPTDTVGGGNCNWTCGSGGPPTPTPAPTPDPSTCPVRSLTGGEILAIWAHPYGLAACDASPCSMTIPGDATSGLVCGSAPVGTISRCTLTQNPFGPTYDSLWFTCTSSGWKGSAAGGPGL